MIKKGGGSRAQFMLSGECAKNSDNYFRAYVSWGCYKLRLMVNEKGWNVKWNKTLCLQSTDSFKKKVHWKYFIINNELNGLQFIENNIF